jgi:hypothetical protein
MATPGPPTSPTPVRSQPKALGQAVKSSHGYQNAAQQAGLHKKAIQTRSAPLHSALVRQKALAGQHLKGIEAHLKAAKSVAKGGVGKELAQVKTVTAPAGQLAHKDAASLEKAMALQKKSALKAMAPAHSALLRQKSLVGQRLAADKSTIGQDMGAFKKAGQQSDAAKFAKKAGQSAKKAMGNAEQRGFGRLLRKVQGS